MESNIAYPRNTKCNGKKQIVSMLRSAQINTVINIMHVLF